MHVEILNCTFDFKAWQAELDTKFEGLTSTKTEKHANHVWRAVRRADLMSHHKGSDKWSIEVSHPDWEGLEPHDDDVIRLYKESMHSTRLSQMPLLVLPKSVCNLKKDDLQVAARSTISDREQKEFLKTAKEIENEPWRLLRGAAYLRQLVERQSSPHPGRDLELKFIHEHVTQTTADPAPDVLGMHFAPDDVRIVKVGAATPAAKRQRLCGPLLPRRPASAMKRRPAAAVPLPPIAEEPHAELEGADRADGDEDREECLSDATVDLPSEPTADEGSGDNSDSDPPDPPGPGGAIAAAAAPVGNPPVPVAVPKAKSTAKAKAKAKAAAGDIPASVVLGCSKCRYAPKGCSTCKQYYREGKRVGPGRGLGGKGRGGRGGKGRGGSSS